MDSRINKLANILVNFSCRVKKGDKVLIDSRGADEEMILALVDEVFKAGAFPFVQLGNMRVTRAIINGMSDDLAKQMADFDAYRMGKMSAFIGIRGGNNSFETSDCDPSLMQIYDKLYSHPVHHELRVKKTNWVVLRWPTEGMAQLAKMSTSAFQKFYFDVCTLDYAKMDLAMNPLKELMLKTDKVKIVAKDTNISFSIKNIGAKKCAGHFNIPDGEIYSAPVKDSVEGYITYNTPSIEKGIEFNNVRLEFLKGKIVKAYANKQEAIEKIFNTDEGARYVGEFALGVNPYITKPMGDILFDEKISGSIHFTPGSCYDDCNNGNVSAIHWDLVQIQTPEYGGGEIYFDDVLIRKDGRFTLPSLQGLNPENLM